jgi:hypothetical protein
MRKTSESGLAKSALLIVFLLLALAGVLAFGFWAYTQRQEYKNNTDKKIVVAVAAAREAQAVELQKQFEEQSKSPNKTFQSGVSSGTVTFSYPKSWSAYVDEGGNSQPINGYFHPNQVPGTGSGASYALRVEMLNTDYSQVVNSLSSKSKEGNLKVAAYIPPKMVDVANVQPGTRFDGVLDKEKTGSMVVIKVRDKTLKVYTESADFLADFNNIILPSLTYLP